jgi:hypothetical protein
MKRHGTVAIAGILGILGIAAAGGCKSGGSGGAGGSTSTTSTTTSATTSSGPGIGGQGQGGAPGNTAAGMLNGQAFTPVDAFFMDGIEKVDGKETAALAIYLVDQPGICAAWQAGNTLPSNALWFDINATHIGPGTYPLHGAALDPAEGGWWSNPPMCTGGFEGGAGTDAGSSLTITEITATLVAGSFNVSFGGFGAVMGTFSATPCKVGFIDPDQSPTMCVSPGSGGAGGSGAGGGDAGP